MSETVRVNNVNTKAKERRGPNVGEKERNGQAK